ncbi:MAG: filamentous hemagglutinin N-terminal domain-containing protein [Cyanophyceae cyanobacterium]
MKQQYYTWVASSLAYFCLATPSVYANPIEADATLAPDNTVVNHQGNTFEITGGVEAGTNLFHSFKQFSVPDGSVARFVNDVSAIENVITRVTGSSPSIINGRLEAGGMAPNFNLFLLNPNGISFGPNASLGLNGSFIATTANAIQFRTQGFFGTNASSDPSVLRINPSALLFSQTQSQPINSKRSSLSLAEGNTLGFVGGEVLIDASKLIVPGGDVELGGLSQPGAVQLIWEGNNFDLGFPPDKATLADVTLTNGAEINVRSSRGGNINIAAEALTILAESKLFAGVEEGTGSRNARSGDVTLQARSVDIVNSELRNRVLGRGQGGSVLITVDNSLRLDGNTLIQSNLGDFGIEAAAGQAGNINIQARSLSLLNGAQIQSNTRGRGNAGQIDIRAHRVKIEGEIEDEEVPGDFFPSAIFSTVGEEAIGSGGNIDIKASTLEISDGGQVLADTLGIGDAGSISIRASEAVALSQSTENNGTLIGSGVVSGAEGNGGIIFLETPVLSLTGGAQIGTNIFGPLKDLPGGIADQGGDISINASDFVLISGFGLRGFSSGVFTSAEEDTTGTAGSINITTANFRIEDGASVDARTENDSAGGNIKINATTFEAVGGGQIQTNARGRGQAGNITANVTGNLTISSSEPGFESRLEKFGEQVVTKFGAESGLITVAEESNGGNITLQNLNLLVLLDGGRILASALQGRGGNINIEAQGVSVANPEAQIDASGEVDGNINIETPNLDPDQRLVKLAVEVVDVENLVAQGCQPGKNLGNSSFTITGRGALTPSPIDTLSPNSVLVDFGTDAEPSPNDRFAPSEAESTAEPALPLAPPEIREAQGWIQEANGKVVLTAQAPAGSSYTSGLSSATCRDFSSRSPLSISPTTTRDSTSRPR